MELEKKCIKCGKTKDLNLFNKDNSRNDGYHPWCKECKANNNKKRYQSNTKHLLLQSKKYREAHKDYYHKKCKNYYEQNKEKILDKKRNCTPEQKEKTNRLRRESDKKIKNKIAERRREEYKKYKQRVHNYFDGKCAICFIEDSCTSMFHCHHVVPESKVSTIANLRSKNWEHFVLPELKKCVYLCANCHAKVHAGVIDLNIKQKRKK